MSKATVFFKISDIFLHLPRNYKKFPNVTRENNFVYDERYGKYTRADLYYDAAKSNGGYPVFVNVHGGGFVRGDKKHRASFCSYIANEGFFVYNVNHRTSPEFTFPSGIADVVSALNALPSLAEKYNLDLSRVLVSGDSSGGFYACAAVVCCTNPDYAKALGITPYCGKISAFVGFCAAYDLEKVLRQKTPLNVGLDVAACMTGLKFKDDVSAIKDFSYYEQINLIPNVTKDFPEAYVLCTDADAFCGGQGELLEAKLTDLGIPCQINLVHGKTHCFHLFPFDTEAQSSLQKAAEYLRKFI